MAHSVYVYVVRHVFTWLFWYCVRGLNVVKHSSDIVGFVSTSLERLVDTYTSLNIVRLASPSNIAFVWSFA